MMTQSKSSKKSKSRSNPIDPTTTNKHKAKTNQAFHDACEAAGIKATVRQYAKWSKRKGLAWQVGHNNAAPAPAGCQAKLAAGKVLEAPGEAN